MINNTLAEILSITNDAVFRLAFNGYVTAHKATSLTTEELAAVNVRMKGWDRKTVTEALKGPKTNTVNVYSTLRMQAASLYQFQATRIAVGNRTTSNVRALLGQGPSQPGEDTLAPELQAALKALRTEGVTEATADAIDKTEEDDGEVSDKLIAAVLARYHELVPETGKLPQARSFKPHPLIPTYDMLVMIGQFADMLAWERRYEAQLGKLLEKLPIYTAFLEGVRGCGTRMSSCLISKLDPAKANHISSFWQICGLGVAVFDGYSEARGRREDHLVDRVYVSANGTLERNRGLCYDPWLKTKVLGVLAPCMIKCSHAALREYKEGRMTTRDIRNHSDVRYLADYLDAKQRYENHEKYGKHNDGKPDDERNARMNSKSYMITSPARREAMSKRIMMKAFLRDLWVSWRGLEGLEITPTYHEAKLGYKHQGGV